MRLLISALLLILSTTASSSWAYPKATDHPQRWQLSFESSGLRFYRDLRTGQGYWVLIYEVTNETDRDQRWVPSFTLVTDHGEVLDSGADVPRRIHMAILETFGDPLLTLQSEMSGSLMRGKEHAIRGLVVWKAGHENVREVQVFIGGVSGDTAKVKNPVTGEQITLHRDLQLSWRIPGSIDGLHLKPLPRREIGGGVSVRRPSTQDVEASAEDQALRRWVFR